MKRERYWVNISTGPILIRRHVYDYTINPATGEKHIEDYESFYEKVFSISLVVFENKISNYSIETYCPDEKKYAYINGFSIENHYNNSYNYKYLGIEDYKISKMTTYSYKDESKYYLDCSYSLFIYDLPYLIDFEEVSDKTFENNIEGTFRYNYQYIEVDCTYCRKVTNETISSLKGSTTTLTIQKLD